MREALILAGLTIATVVAMFGPDGDAAPAQPAPAAQPAALAPTALIPPAAPTELKRAGDGHFYAGVQVGGHPVTMLVDTGASMVALTGTDAHAAGLRWNPTELKVVATGAGGPVRGVKLKLDRLTLGAHEARNVAAVIIPDGLPVSLLGQSFLATIEPVRIEKDRMVLGGA